MQREGQRCDARADRRREAQPQLPPQHARAAPSEEQRGEADGHEGHDEEARSWVMLERRGRRTYTPSHARTAGRSHALEAPAVLKLSKKYGPTESSYWLQLAAGWVFVRVPVVQVHTSARRNPPVRVNP